MLKKRFTSFKILIDLDENNASSILEIEEEPTFSKKNSQKNLLEDENYGEPTFLKKAKLEIGLTINPKQIQDLEKMEDFALISPNLSSSKNYKSAELEEIKQILTYEEIQALKHSGISTSVLVSNLLYY